jgi:uncharacterized membrane protein YccC
VLAFCDAFRLSGRPAWTYGLLCGGAICALLLVGTLTGQIAHGSVAALGAYLVVVTDDFALPYGARARRLLRGTLFVTVGVTLGVLIAPHPWLAVPMIALVAAAGAHWPAIGLPPTLAVILSYFAGPVADGVLPHMLLTAAGGLWITAVILIAWPVRRLRPLREAFQSAGTALADLLEAAAESEDDAWETPRRAASKTIAQARGAVAHYTAVKQEEAGGDPTLERMLRALTRIFHAAAAVHILREALDAHETDCEWRDQLDATLRAQARALREAVEHGSTLTVPAALAAGARFVDLAESVRRGAPAERRPLAAAVLIGEVSRSVDRIGVAVRSAALLSAEGVEVAPRLPRLPRPEWRRLELRRPGPRAADHPARLGLVAAGATVLMLTLHEQYGKWFVATVVANLRSTYGETVDRVIFPVVGTALGAVAGAVVLAVTPGHIALALFIGGCAVLGYALRPLSFPWWMLFATPLSLLLTDFVRPVGWGAALVRVILTVAGGVVVFVAARLLWPHGERARLPGRIADLVEEHAALVRALVEQRPEEVRERLSTAAESERRVAESLDRLAREPGGDPPQSLRDAVLLAQRVRDDVLALFAVLRPDDSSPATALLDAVADRLEATASAIRSGTPAVSSDDLDEALDVLASHVGMLTARQLDELPEGGVEDWTAIRYAYTYAAAAHPTLKTLVSDVVRLCRAVA